MVDVHGRRRCDGPGPPEAPEIDEAADALNRAAEYTEDPAPPWTMAWMSGQVAQQLGNLEEAERDFRKVLEDKTPEMIRRKFDFSLDYEVRNQLGVVLFDRDYILYYAGFAFIPTERPIAFLLSADGEAAMFVPRLEVEHAQGMAAIGRVGRYLEYPYDPHPAEILKDFLGELGITGSIGADHDGYPWIFGYRGRRSRS